MHQKQERAQGRKMSPGWRQKIPQQLNNNAQRVTAANWSSAEGSRKYFFWNTKFIGDDAHEFVVEKKMTWEQKTKHNQKIFHLVEKLKPVPEKKSNAIY